MFLRNDAILPNCFGYNKYLRRKISCSSVFQGLVKRWFLYSVLQSSTNLLLSKNTRDLSLSSINIGGIIAIVFIYLKFGSCLSLSLSCCITCVNSASLLTASKFLFLRLPLVGWFVGWIWIVDGGIFVGGKVLLLLIVLLESFGISFISNLPQRFNLLSYSSTRIFVLCFAFNFVLLIYCIILGRNNLCWLALSGIWIKFALVFETTSTFWNNFICEKFEFAISWLVRRTLSTAERLLLSVVNWHCDFNLLNFWISSSTWLISVSKRSIFLIISTLEIFFSSSEPSSSSHLSVGEVCWSL